MDNKPTLERKDVLKRHNKVAQITLSFWLMKILATTLGETSGDLLSMTLNLGYVVGLMITAVYFLIALAVQLRCLKFHSFSYWAVIVGTTMVGTEISDMMDRTLHLGYAAGSLILAGCLALTLAVWQLIEKNLEVYPITERRKELLYWIAILFSNSLGTAFGDWLSDSMGLSYIGGALVCAAVIALVIVLHYAARLNEVLLFWIAFVFTRPFGATFGDLLTKPIDKGGFNLGTVPASAVTFALLTLIVVYTHHRLKQTEI